MLSVFVALLIPACGYYGGACISILFDYEVGAWRVVFDGNCLNVRAAAKQRDRTWMCCFCGCSLFEALVLAMMLWSILSHLISGDDSNSETDTTDDDEQGETGAFRVFNLILLFLNGLLYVRSHFHRLSNSLISP